MTIEKDIHYILKNDADVAALVNTRIYPMKLPQGWTLPAITYQRISGDRAAKYAGASGRARPRFQIDCWASDYDGVKDLADKVRKCLDGYKGDINTENNVGGIHLEGDRDIWEDNIDVFRVTMDFVIPHFETT
jgi:hypothetical protein